MERVPKDWTIWEYKEQRMLNTKHYLVNMLDPSIKQTLYVMLNIDVKPQSWEVIATSKFFIINGQHSIATNKDTHTLGLPKDIVKYFRKWS